jgi:DNA processing protein
MKENTALVGEIHRLRPTDAYYPQRVLELPGRARVLRALGELDVLQKGPALAVVGTRNAGPEILKSTRRVVELSAEFEMVIVSGISPGVDTAAHEAALDLGLATIAVPGCGIDALLDGDRSALAHRIVESGGLLLSPFPGSCPETSERRWWRNRIISALCHGLVMVASEPGGGELEAHRWARQLERRLIEPSED